jgi:pyruvate dehydrogenase E2 component (dihydrolipoamide acetyltransferase)
MPTQIKLPSLGEGVDSADVLSILVSEGDTIQPEQDILEIETEKATVPVPASQAGRVTKVLVSQGDTIQTGSPLLEIEPADGDGKKTDAGEDRVAPAAKEEKPKRKEKSKPEPAEDVEEPSDEAEGSEEEAPPPKKATKRQPRRDDAAEAEPIPGAAARSAAADIDSLPKVAGQTPGDGASATAASPTVRRLARQLGVDLRRIRPTGEGGRITTDDVTAYVRQASRRLEAATGGQKDLPGEPDADDWGPVRRERMTRLRQTIARNMVRSYTTIPQLTNFDDADITELEDLREESKDDYAKTGIKLTTMPFLIKAVASALKKHPMVNASVDTESNEIIYKEYVSIGIAVDTPRGLIVPVLRDADRMNIPQIAAELARLGELARDGKYTIEDLRGGTFTISNLGSIGGTYSTPIINPPEVAILLAGRARILPTYIDGQLRPRLQLPLSLTYDHRLVDGATAARFLNEVKGFLTAPGRLLLAP